MAEVRLENVSKIYHGKTIVIPKIDLRIPANQLTVFVGPSGCGKSTLLKLIAGLEEVSGGKIIINNKDVTHLAPSKRGIAMVFQSYALYPHMTVFENMAFALKIAGASKEHIRERVEEVAKILQLTQLLDRKPRQLSGGQRQRVAIGRALVRKPDVFLLDEPLSNLDAALRVDMRIEIAKIRMALNATMVYVTHDQVEAMTLADNIVVLRGGVIEQMGPPLDIYHKPQNRFVAGFLGSPSMNFIESKVVSAQHSEVQLHGPGFLRDFTASVKTNSLSPGENVVLGIRPENIHIVDSATNADFIFTALVEEQLGDHALIYGNIGSSRCVLKVDPDFSVKSGSKLHVKIDRQHYHVFDSKDQSVVDYATRSQSAAIVKLQPEGEKHV